MEDKFIYSLEMKVRDYEVDSEGIVNNANYLHYLEHTRHEFCLYAGFPYKEMQKQGLMPVLSRVEIDYKTPLRSDDMMVSRLWVEMQGVRFVFHQQIINKDTQAVAVNAIVSVVCLENGRLTRGEIYA
ncbi:MAG: acyl-CoA thioesterase, partial [Bacteroidales bacterium]|nr:acyl-CoA thioesterase [Bacteroidales bacterium]